MANPIILYDNHFFDGVLTATDTALGYNVLNIRDYRTYTFWQAASAGTKYITVDCNTDKSADTLAVIGHNLKAANATVSVESSPDDSTWTTRLSAFTPSSDKAFLRTFTSASARYWRIKIVTATIAPRLAVVMLGNRLTFPYPPDAPYIPYSESIETDSSKSKLGHLLGSVIRHKSIEISAKFSNLPRNWVLNNFKVFWDNHASDLKPFFYAWDIDTFPDMVFFVSIAEKSKYEMPLSILGVVDEIKLSMIGIKEV